MKRHPIELNFDEFRTSKQIATEPGQRFINNDIAMLYDIARHHDLIPVILGQPYRLHEYRIARILSGTGLYVINLTEYEAHEGDILFCLPNDIIELRSISPDCNLQIIAPSERLMTGLPPVRETGLQQGICFHPGPEDWQHAGHYFHLLWEALFRTPFNPDAIRHLLTALLLTLKPMYEAESTSPSAQLSRAEKVLRQFLALVNQYARTQRNIEFYADRLCLSPHYLSNLVREACGQTVMQWINRSVILEAKVLLKHSDLLTYQIADELNFPNPSFFSKFFKRMTGMTPGEYRDNDNKI